MKSPILLTIMVHSVGIGSIVCFGYLCFRLCIYLEDGCYDGKLS